MRNILHIFRKQIQNDTSVAHTQGGIIEAQKLQQTKQVGRPHPNLTTVDAEQLPEQKLSLNVPVAITI